MKAWAVLSSRGTSCGQRSSWRPRSSARWPSRRSVHSSLFSVLARFVHPLEMVDLAPQPRALGGPAEPGGHPASALRRAARAGRQRAPTMASPFFTHPPRRGGDPRGHPPIGGPGRRVKRENRRQAPAAIAWPCGARAPSRSTSGSRRGTAGRRPCRRRRGCRGRGSGRARRPRPGAGRRACAWCRRRGCRRSRIARRGSARVRSTSASASECSSSGMPCTPGITNFAPGREEDPRERVRARARGSATSSGWKFQVELRVERRAARAHAAERAVAAARSRPRSPSAACRASRCLSARPEPGMRTASTPGGAHSVSSLKPSRRKCSDW